MNSIAQWLLMSAIAAFLAGCACDKPNPEPHAVSRPVSISRYHTTALTDGDADRILLEANSVLEEINGSGDMNCTVGLQRSGPVTTFTTGDGEIDSQAEFDQIIALPGNIKIVNAINFCSQPGAFIIGCAPVPGNSLVVVRLDAPGDREEGILWAHEYGHNRGLHHRGTANNEVMNPTVTPSHTFVNAAEKSAYENTQTAAQAGSGDGATEAATAPATQPQDVKAFVRKRYVEGLPYQEASAFGPNDVPVLIKMLDDPADAKWRPNIVTLLGIIGDPRAVDPMIKVIEEGQGVIKPVEYGAKKGAIVFLGEVINKTNDPQNPAVIKAFDYLKEGAVNPGVWSQRVQWTSPFTQDATQRNWQLTKAAIWALALTGRTEAGDALKLLATKIPSMNDVPADLADLIKEAQAALAAVKKDGLKMYRMQHRE